MDNDNFQEVPIVTLTQPQNMNIVQEFKEVKPRKRKIFFIVFLIIVVLAIVSFIIFNFIFKQNVLPPKTVGNKDRPLETSITTENKDSPLEISVELNSQPSSWPTYVNLRAGYSLKYPRELFIREMDGYVVFETRGTGTTQASITAVVEGENVSSITDWVKENSDETRSKDRRFERVENLKQTNVNGLDGVIFTERRKNICFESPCADDETLTLQQFVNKENSLLGFSCKSCPKNVESIWNEMANSFVAIKNNSPTISISNTTRFANAGISVSYPSDWFVKPDKDSIVLSSFNNDGFSDDYFYGIEISIGKCSKNSRLDCMKDSFYQGASKTEQEVIDKFGGVVEKIDTLTMEGYIYGQMKKETYEDIIPPVTAFLVNKKNNQVVWIHSQLSLYMGSFELNKRIVDYYYPAFKEIVKSINLL